MSHRAPPPELTGVLLGGRYRVVRALERGGMGSIYEARDERIGRAVAVKVMLPELANDAVLLERFRREALATAALAHANIVQVTDYGAEPGGHAFLAMELIAGRSLAAILTESGALPVARAVSIARQVCAALEAAHAAGIVHRDLKPGNVLIVPLADGRELVKVVDFGVAQLKRSAAYGRLTSTGAVLGTPAFMPPEQARGEEVDARADVYAVGAMLYGCLAGRKPFDGPDPATVIRQLLTEAPIPLTSLRRDVGPALANVVATAMAKQRGARFASAHALSDALAAALGDDGDVAPHAPAREVSPVTSDAPQPGAFPSTYASLPGTATPAGYASMGGTPPTASPSTRVARTASASQPRELPPAVAPPALKRRSPVAWVLLALAGLVIVLLAVVGTMLALKLATARAASVSMPARVVPLPARGAAPFANGAGPPIDVAMPSPGPAAAVPPPKPRSLATATQPEAGLPLVPTPAPPTEHHRAHHGRADAGTSNDGWVSSGWLTNPARVQ